MTWTVVASDTFTLGATALVGLGVSSHVAGVTATATFDHVTVTAGRTAAAQHGPGRHADESVERRDRNRAGDRSR